MTERVCFYFDPVCPWCYQTSRWARRVEELGHVELTWALFSLELQNAGKESAERTRSHARSAPALRAAVLARDAGGPAAVGTFYAAVGERYHQQGQPLDDLATVEAALRDVDLDPGLAQQAMDDERTWDQVTSEHRTLVERTRSFGVPTLVLDGGQGPAIFGPVISEPPSDGDAVELLRHTAWLARHADFSELKRERPAPPELASVRR